MSQPTVAEVFPEPPTLSAPSRLISASALMTRPKPPMLIADILPDGGIGVIAGPTGSGKSLLAIGMGCSIGTGEPWAGQAILRPGAVIYVAAEGVGGLGARFKAWTLAHRWDDLLPVWVWSDALPIRRPEAAQALIDEAAPLEPRVVIVDTVNRTLFGNENDAGDMGEYIAGLDQLRLGLGATILAVHHSGWDPSRERGHSSLRGACDVMMLVRAEPDAVILTCEKARDVSAFTPIRFVYQPIPEADSVVLRLAATEDDDLSGASRKALTALREIMLPGGITGTAWLEASGLSKSSFYRALSALVKTGLAVERKHRYTLGGSE